MKRRIFTHRIDENSYIIGICDSILFGLFKWHYALRLHNGMYDVVEYEPNHDWMFSNAHIFSDIETGIREAEKWIKEVKSAQKTFMTVQDFHKNNPPIYHELNRQ